jgi:hypothetical protein
LDPEGIKERIAEADSRYFLEKRGATHHILYCRLPGWMTHAGRRVKVDILVPPALNLPKFTESEVNSIDGIPVMPIFEVLVTKMQAWWDRRTSTRRDNQDKESADVSDILALLKCARAEMVSYVDEANKYRHSQEFMSHARALVIRFVDVYGRHRQWRALQFPDV